MFEQNFLNNKKGLTKFFEFQMCYDHNLVRYLNKHYNYYSVSHKSYIIKFKSR